VIAKTVKTQKSVSFAFDKIKASEEEKKSFLYAACHNTGYFNDSPDGPVHLAEMFESRATNNGDFY
jgi:hypothetical protein